MLKKTGKDALLLWCQDQTKDYFPKVISFFFKIKKIDK